MNCRVQSYASRSTGLDELDDSLTKDLTEVEKKIDENPRYVESEREGMHSKKCYEFSLTEKHEHNLFESKFYSCNITSKDSPLHLLCFST